MATHDIPILGAMTAPDSSGRVFFQPALAAMTLGTADFGTLLVCTMKAPTVADIGLYGKFNIPQNYAGTPVLVIRGVITETGATTIAFGFKQAFHTDTATFDVGLETEDIANNAANWTGYDPEDMYEETIVITPSVAFATGDEVTYFFFRDNSVDTQSDATGDFNLTGLFFRYSDT